MADNKKYYWLKLKDDFFSQPKIKKLRRIAGGDTYTIIYLKMQLLSLKNGGKLYFEGIEENFIEEIALTIDEDIENVKVTIMYLLKQGLLEEVSADEYEMTETVESICSETASTIRSRRCRERQKALQCNTTATDCNAIETNCNTEIDIDIEKDIRDREKREDIEIETDKENTILYTSIIDYLNSRAGTHYLSSTKPTQKHINARLEEGFTIDDFKTVIDKKCNEWLGTEFEKFLRPQTLFGTKFESYLNANNIIMKKSSNVTSGGIDWDNI